MADFVKLARMLPQTLGWNACRVPCEYNHSLLVNILLAQFRSPMWQQVLILKYLPVINASGLETPSSSGISICNTVGQNQAFQQNGRIPKIVKRRHYDRGAGGRSGNLVMEMLLCGVIAWPDKFGFPKHCQFR